MDNHARKISYLMSEDVDVEEFRKIISFISEDILSYEFDGNECNIYITELADEQEILEKVKEYSKKFVSLKNEKKEYLYQNNYTRNYHQLLYDNSFFFYNDGAIGLNGKALFLYAFFEKEFKQIAHELYEECIDKLYPVLLDITDYTRTGYLHNSPQYSIFCSNVKEDIKVLERVEEISINSDKTNILASPRFVLSPSACFHVYAEYQNRILYEDVAITFTQNVFRNEGRLNFDEIGRLRDYHVREIVFLGREDFVISKRNEAISRVYSMMKEFRLCGNISAASDSFIMPQIQRFKKIQIQEKIKYETQLNYDENKLMSVASFNLHGDTFSHAFNIKSANGKKVVSGCIGFGLERWVMCFIAQYGDDVNLWPNRIRKEYMGEGSRR